MDKASITALGAIAVGIISLISAVIVALITQRMNARTLRDIEQLRAASAADLERLRATLSADLERVRAGLTEASAQVQRAQERTRQMSRALHQGIRAVQRVKDDIQLILTAVPGSLDIDSAIHLVRQGRQQLVECFEKQVASLDDQESKLLHEAKSLAMTLDHPLMTTDRDNDVSNLSNEARERLVGMRLRLSDLQNSLRDRALIRLG
jgi:hypothetical protein